MYGWQGSCARIEPGATLLVTLALVCGVACAREEPPSAASSDIPEAEQLTGITRNFVTTESDSGKVRYEFRAEIARSYADDVTRAERIEVDFYEDGRKVSVLTAKRGILRAGRMTAEGNVVVVALEDSTVLETETLYWDDEKDKIRSDDVFRITEDGDVLTGRGLTTDPDLKFVDIEDAEITIQNPEIR